MISKQVKNSTETSAPKKKSMAILRLQKDLASFQANIPPYTTLQFPDESSIQNIIVKINLNLSKEDMISTKSPYYKCHVNFSLVFSDTYPIDPPKLKCLSKIYHPNINYNGSVCLPLVREDWSPTVTLQQIIYGIIFILMTPNGEDALEPEIGDQMKENYQLYLKIVDHTADGRNFRNKTYDCIRF